MDVSTDKQKSKLPKHSHVFKLEGTFNSRKRAVRCLPGWPCKRIICQHCREIRRKFFINEGTLYVEQRGLFTHFVVGWPLLHVSHSPWDKLFKLVPPLAKTFSGLKVGPYIRTLGIGDNGCPHMHFLVRPSVSDAMKEAAYKHGPKETDVFIGAVTEPAGLLGYFFDNNFVPTFLNPERPKRFRVLTASRGMPCGFPTVKQEKAAKGRTQ